MRRVLLLSLALLGCPVREDVSERPQERPAAAPFDVGQLIRRVHFAWRNEDDAWSAGDATWSASLAPGGLSLTPADGAVRGSLRLGSATVSRGAQALTTRWAARGLETGALSVDRGEVVEEYENDERGIEQRWRFSRAPVGGGPLEVRIPVEGRLVAATDTGLHFAAGLLLVRYGHATWIDATGRRTAVPARFERGAISLTVPDDVLASSAWPAVLDPIISMQQSVDTPLARPAPSNQQLPAIATSGSTHLVVWQDMRGGVTHDIFAARVTAAGQVLDPTGIALTNDVAEQLNPAVAWNGLTWLVVWSDTRGMAADIFGARVESLGTRADPLGGFAISLAAGAQTTPAVDCDAVGTNNCLVVWRDERTSANGDIYGTLVSAGGMIAAASGLGIETLGTAQNAPTVAWDGFQFLVAYEDGTPPDIMARLVSATSAVGTNALAVSTGTAAERSPRASGTGTGTVVVWVDERNLNPDVACARLSLSGALLDANGIMITDASGSQTRPAVASSPTMAFITWEDAMSGDVIAARLLGTGAVVDMSGFTVTPAMGVQRAPAVARNGMDFFVVWEDARQGPLDIYGARVSGSAMAANALIDTSGLLISQGPIPERNPAVATNGTNYLVVWEDDRAGISDIWGARVSAAGVSLEPAGVIISNAVGPQKYPKVAAANDYFVVWQDARAGGGTTDIYGARVTAALGPVTDTGGIAIVTANLDQGRPAITWDGVNWVVAWQDARNGTLDIYAGRVQPPTTLLDGQGTAVSVGPGDQGRPAVASSTNGTTLVVWQDSRATSQDIGGRVLQRDGGPLAPEFSISTAMGDQTAPSLTWAGNGWVTVWEDTRAGQQDVFGARVSASGGLIDSLTLATGPSAQREPTVAWDGRHSLVAFADNTGAPFFALRATRLAADGGLVDPSPFFVGALNSDVVTPAVACRPRDCLVTWSSYLSTVDATRILSRRITNNDAPLASSQTVTAMEDTSININLGATDPDGDTLTYQVVVPVARGVLTGAGPTATVNYTPQLDFNGVDSFTFQAIDQLGLASTIATVVINVTPVNDPPTALPQLLYTPVDMPVSVTLQGVDVDNDPLTFNITSMPTSGVLNGTPPNVTYVPNPGYVGFDGFSFTVRDSVLTSVQAVVSIRVGSPDGGAAGGGAAGGGAAGGGAAGGGAAGGGAAGGGAAGGGAAGGGAAAGGAAGGGAAGGAAGGGTAGGAGGAAAGGAAGGSASAGGSAAGGTAGGVSAGGAAGGGDAVFVPAACGCTTSAAFPLVLAGLAVLATGRRRGRGSTSRPA